MVEQRLRREYGEPPSQVLKGYADMGYGIKATAQAMEISRPTLRKLAKRFGVEFKQYRDLNASCKPPGRKAWTMTDYLIGFLADRMKEAT